jgi:hypothetical protein
MFNYPELPNTEPKCLSRDVTANRRKYCECALCDCVCVSSLEAERGSSISSGTGLLGHDSDDSDGSVPAESANLPTGSIEKEFQDLV